jgi:hypothetical protein
VLRTAKRLSIRVAEIPALARLDEAAHVVAADQFGAFAGSTSSAAHQAGCHDRLETLPPTPVNRIRVASSRETGSHPVPAVVGAVALVLGGCNVLASAAEAVAKAEGALPPPVLRTSHAARTAELLISVIGAERPRTA